MRRLTVIGAIIATIFALAAPAHAAPLPVLLGTANGVSGTHRVTAACAAEIGITTGLNEVTYVVEGEASSYTTDGHAYGIGTGVTCKIKDRNTGTLYGSVSGALFGPQAVAAGTIDVPLNSNPYLCVVANALFSDNHTASANSC